MVADTGHPGSQEKEAVLISVTVAMRNQKISWEGKGLFHLNFHNNVHH